MCGRYDLHEDARTLARHFGIHEGAQRSFVPRYNVSPGTTVAVIVQQGATRALEGFHWGFTPHWAPPAGVGSSGRRIAPINARADKVDSSGLYRAAFRETRCVFPMNGFYEPDKAQSRPYPQLYYRRRDEELIAVAGIYAHWRQAPAESAAWSCALITTQPNRTVAAGGHDRMPVILPGTAIDAWLDPLTPTDTLRALLQPAPDDLLEGWEVDRKALNRRQSDGHWAQGAELLEPISERRV